MNKMIVGLSFQKRTHDNSLLLSSKSAINNRDESFQLLIAKYTPTVNNNELLRNVGRRLQKQNIRCKKNKSIDD